jgi:peptidase M28-like protein
MRRLAIVIAALAAAPLSAQYAPPSPPVLQHAAETIVEGDVTHRISIIAADSMMGRDTPSPGLEKTAQYVADNFRKFGLKPGGDSGTFIQRYAIVRARFNPAASVLEAKAGDASATVRFDRDARTAGGAIPGQPLSGEVVLLGGALDSASVSGAALRDKLVLLALDYSKKLPSDAQVLTPLLQQAPRAVIVLSNRDSTAFVRRLATQAMERVGPAVPAQGPAFVEVRERALRSVLAGAGVNAATVYASRTPVVRQLSRLQLTLSLRDTVLSSVTAPNTIGILEGSDPVLKNEYLVYSAHMDHIGITSGAKDSINNGADDDASGTIGVVELAEAFSQPGARPKRSVIFMTVSGEEKGLWGSEYFSAHPTVPLAQIVADINIDMIGRNWKDTIVAIGQEHSDLGETLRRVNRAHPELHMAVIDDIWPEESFYFRSDHFNFARKGVPILFFFNGVHADYHKPSDSPDKIDGEKEARILRMVFYLGEEIANASARPKWNPESYRRIVGSEGGS